MIRRKICLRDRAIRVSLEILAMLGSAVLIGYWIVHSSRYLDNLPPAGLHW